MATLLVLLDLLGTIVLWGMVGAIFGFLIAPYLKGKDVDK